MKYNNKTVEINKSPINIKIPENLKIIHQKAMAASQAYKKSEADLLEAIVEVRNKKVYRYFNCTSLYQYCVEILKLDAGAVYSFTAVAKILNDVPEIKNEISAGRVTISAARRIASVVTKENASEWLAKAATLSVRKLEHEITKVNPQAEVKERASYLTSKRVKLELGLEEALMLKIRKIQDLESQKRRRSVSLEETFAAMGDAYLSKHDPFEKAKRAKIRGQITQGAQVVPTEKKMAENLIHVVTKFGTCQKSGPAIRRMPIPKAILHQVYLRDQGKCQKCLSQRFVEIHHQKPLSQGGAHTLQNLITLCSEHHKMMHMT